MIDYKRLDEYFESLKTELSDAPPEERVAAWERVLNIINRHAKQAGANLDAELSAAKEKFKL